MFLSEIYELEDWWVYDPTSSIRTELWNSSGNISVDSNFGLNFPKSTCKLYLKQLFPNGYIIEWEWNYWGSSTNYPLSLAFFNSSGSQIRHMTMQRYSTYDKFFGGMGFEPQFHASNQGIFRFEVRNDSIICYLDDELIFTYENTANFPQYYVGFRSDSNIAQYVKNIKIKSL